MVKFHMADDVATVLVAVSGGPDSTCLLDVLARQRSGSSLQVAHVDHGLSPSSEVVAARVSNAAAAAGFDVHVARAPDLQGPNLQARAREFRYSFFETIAAEIGAERIATGHTLDDRVETTLARLIHGASTSGLAGIPATDGRRIRPLIDVRRAETRAYCVERGLDFYEDPANEDPRFDRASVRADIVTAIEKRWGDGAVRAMATSAQLLREDADALERLSERVYASVATATDDGVRIDRPALLEMPRAFRRRILERAVGRVRDRSGGIEAALDVLEDPFVMVPANARFAVASGIVISFDGDHLLVGPGADVG